MSNNKNTDLGYDKLQGGGLSEAKEVWLEKYAEFTQPFTPGKDKGVFKLLEVAISDKPDYGARRNGIQEIRNKAGKVTREAKTPEECKDNMKTVIDFTFGLVNEKDDSPIINKEHNKPMAIDYEVKVPSPKLLFNTFETTAFFQFFKELGYEMTAQDSPNIIQFLDDAAASGRGLYAKFAVILNDSKDKSRQYANVESKSLIRHIGRLTEAQQASNEALLQEAFASKREV